MGGGLVPDRLLPRLRDRWRSGTLFNSARAAHCFVYADYGVTQGDLEADLADPMSRFRGNDTLGRVPLDPSGLRAARGRRTSIPPKPERTGIATLASPVSGFLRFSSGRRRAVTRTVLADSRSCSSAQTASPPTMLSSVSQTESVAMGRRSLGTLSPFPRSRPLRLTDRET